MKYTKFQISLATVVMLVVLRLCLGCHFLYEGVWKITHPEFSAEGFLVNAKGPAAPIFYAMVPDIDGRSRLKVEKVVVGDNLIDALHKVHNVAENQVGKEISKSNKPGEEREKLRAEFKQKSSLLTWQYEEKLESLLAKNEKAMQKVLADPKVEGADEKAQKWLGELREIEKQYNEKLVELYGQMIDSKPLAPRAVVPSGDDAATLGKMVSVRNRVRGSSYVNSWDKLAEDVVRKYVLTPDQEYEVARLYHLYKDSVKEYLDGNLEDIEAHFGSLHRYEAAKAAGNNGADFQKEHAWSEMQKLRSETKAWFGELEGMGDDYAVAIWNTLDDDQKAKGKLPIGWTVTDLINFAVTYGLTAIGLCLILGLCTRFAAIGGGCFMTFVVLTQPGWPTIYPHAPAVVGHSLLINKDFIEMVTLFLLATTAAGRWGGLDYFVENFVLWVYRSWAEGKS